jgi:hypothetical protein
MATYNESSPWYDTTKTQWYLDRLSIRPINAEPDDTLYTIESKFQWRPDYLAYHLYKNQHLWWVLVQRNLDVINDPIFDFTTGTKIYLPRAAKLKELLGI